MKNPLELRLVWVSQPHPTTITFPGVLPRRPPIPHVPRNPHRKYVGHGGGWDYWSISTNKKVEKWCTTTRRRKTKKITLLQKPKLSRFCFWSSSPNILSESLWQDETPKHNYDKTKHSKGINIFQNDPCDGWGTRKTCFPNIMRRKGAAGRQHQYSDRSSCNIGTQITNKSEYN